LPLSAEAPRLLDHPTPGLEDAAAREVRRLVAEEKKQKKDEAKKWAHKRMLARDLLEKHRRAQAREGLPLEDSPSTEEEEDDDDYNDEGMEVYVAFRPEVGPSSMPAFRGPSGGAVPSAQRPAASLSGARASAKPAPVPASAEEEEVIEGEVAPFPRKSAWRLRARRPGPFNGHPLRGIRSRNPALPLTQSSRGL
jgi:hypothetical protein